MDLDQIQVTVKYRVLTRLILFAPLVVAGNFSLSGSRRAQRFCGRVSSSTLGWDVAAGGDRASLGRTTRSAAA